MTPERKFRNKVQKELKTLRNAWWTSIQQRAIVGTPDVLGCIGGKIVALEFKARENAHRSAMQEKTILDINRAGGYAKFVYPENWFQIWDELRFMDDEHDR